MKMKTRLLSSFMDTEELAKEAVLIYTRQLFGFTMAHCEFSIINNHLMVSHEEGIELAEYQMDAMEIACRSFLRGWEDSANCK